MIMIKKEEEERKEVGEPIRKRPLTHYTLKSKILLKMTSADKRLPKIKEGGALSGTVPSRA